MWYRNCSMTPITSRYDVISELKLWLLKARHICERIVTSPKTSRQRVQNGHVGYWYDGCRYASAIQNSTFVLPKTDHICTCAQPEINQILKLFKPAATQTLTPVQWAQGSPSESNTCTIKTQSDFDTCTVSIQSTFAIYTDQTCFSAARYQTAGAVGAWHARTATCNLVSDQKKAALVIGCPTILEISFEGCHPRLQNDDYEIMI